MNRSLQIRAGLTVAVLLLSIFGLMPTFKALMISSSEREAAQDNPERLEEIAEIDAQAIRRGLDLKGGMYLVLEVDQEGMSSTEAADALLRVKEILYNRIDKFGVSEPEITTFGSSRIVVKLPGLQDPERAKNLLGRTARLEFRMVRPETEIPDVLERLDQLFLADAPVTEGDTETAAVEDVDPAAEVEAAADSTAVAETDTAANPFGDLADLPGDPGVQAEADREALLATNPFTGLLIVQPGAIPDTPLLVMEKDVDRVQALLDDPRVARRLRNLELQMGMDPYDFGEGQQLRPLYLVDVEPIITGDQLTNAMANSNQDRPGFWQVNFSLGSRGARAFANHHRQFHQRRGQ